MGLSAKELAKLMQGCTGEIEQVIEEAFDMGYNQGVLDTKAENEGK